MDTNTWAQDFLLFSESLANLPLSEPKMTDASTFKLILKSF